MSDIRGLARGKKSLETAVVCYKSELSIMRYSLVFFVLFSIVKCVICEITLFDQEAHRLEHNLLPGGILGLNFSLYPKTLHSRHMKTPTHPLCFYVAPAFQTLATPLYMSKILSIFLGDTYSPCSIPISHLQDTVNE